MNDHESDQASEEKEEEDDTPAPEGNGGQTDKYRWTQTLDALEVTLRSPHLSGRCVSTSFCKQKYSREVLPSGGRWSVEM